MYRPLGRGNPKPPRRGLAVNRPIAMPSTLGQGVIGWRDHENERPTVCARTFGPDMLQCDFARSRSRKLKPTPCDMVESAAIYHDDARCFEPNRQFRAP
jgi:hypothetical protein